MVMIEPCHYTVVFMLYITVFIEHSVLNECVQYAMQRDCVFHSVARCCVNQCV